MEALATGDVFLFEGFRLDRRCGLFRRDERGVFVPMAIGSRAFDLLGVLVERSGDLISRDAIIAAVWPSTVVADNNLNMQIPRFAGFSIKTARAGAASKPSPAAAIALPGR